jgi:AraC family transcriptional regulator
MQFADALVAAAARQLVDELHNGRSADESFMARLAELMLEQAFRVLTTSNTTGIHPQHVHFSRLQRVLRHINAHLTEPLPNAKLAELAGVSESHFRRIFLGAVGMPPHHYIRNRRLAQARKLLVMSDLPISMISDECGFYSQSHLTKCFQTTHAVAPAAYRRQMKQGSP